jgi:DNA-binding response OmpR family regulator
VVEVNPMCYLDLLSQCISINNEIYSLSKIEFRIVYLFVKQPNKLIYYDDLMQFVWNYKSESIKCELYVYIKKIRGLLERHSRNCNCIVCVRGKGYIFIAENLR